MIPGIHQCWRKCYRLTLLALLAAIAARAGDPELIAVVGIADRDAQKRIEGLAAAAEREVEFLFRGSPPPQAVRFSGATAIAELRQDRLGCVFPVNPKLSDRELQSEIIRALLYRRTLRYRSVDEFKPRHLPDWLVAAVHYRVALHAVKVMPADWYRSSRALVRRHRIPALRSLVDQPIAAGEPLLYELYADTAACLLQVLLRTEPLLIEQLLKTTQPLQTPYRNLSTVLPENSSEDKLQVWFAERFQKVTEAPGTHLEVAAVQQEVAEIERFPLAAGGTEPKQVPIDEIRQQDPEYQFDTRDLDRRLEKLYRLQLRAPLLLQPAVREYIKAYTLLRNGRESRFNKSVQEARAQLAQAVAQYNRIDAFLETLERGPHSPARRLEQFRPVIEAGLEPTAFEKAVNDYLRELEKRLDAADHQVSP